MYFFIKFLSINFFSVHDHLLLKENGPQEKIALLLPSPINDKNVFCGLYEVNLNFKIFARKFFDKIGPCLTAYTPDLTRFLPLIEEISPDAKIFLYYQVETEIDLEYDFDHDENDDNNNNKRNNYKSLLYQV